MGVLASSPSRPAPDGVTVRAQLSIALATLSCVAALACVAVVASPLEADAATPDHPDPLTVLSGGGDGPHQLVPGATYTWPIEVRVDVAQLDSLFTRLSVTGPLARSDDVTAEMLSCPVDWVGDQCTAGPYTILPTTPIDRLPASRSTLEPVPRPGTTHIQVRIHITSDARLPDDAAMTATLQVDASGQDGAETGGGAGGHTGASGPPMRLTVLADTGQNLPAYGVLAAGAVAAGLLLAGIAGRIQERRRKRA